MRRVRDQRGQALVESALIVPVLMLLVLGMVDFALVLQTYIGIVNAAGVGASYAAENGTSGLEAAVRAETDSNSLHCATLTVDPAVFSAADDDEAGFYKVTVTVRCQTSDLTGFINHLTLSWSAASRSTRSE